MAVKIRLKRTGAKKQPSYRIVVADSRAPRDGRFIEEIGFYNPQSNPKQLKVDEEAARSWLAKGAQPTDTVRSILKKVGVIEDNSRKEFAPKVEKAEGEAAPQAAEEAEVVTPEEAEVEEAKTEEAAPEEAKAEEAEVEEAKTEEAEVESTKTEEVAPEEAKAEEAEVEEAKTEEAEVESTKTEEAAPEEAKAEEADKEDKKNAESDATKDAE